LSALRYYSRAFGEYWASDIALHHFDRATENKAESGFTVRQISQLPLRNKCAQKGRGEIYDDGFRFSWDDVATFDAHALRDIRYLPLSKWCAVLPDCFFSTVAALSVAAIGKLPMHASAVELDGRAFLFAGTAGAGKSTLTAELLAHGARFIGDDLTVLCPPESDSGFRVALGRPAMRLHPATAAMVDAESCEQVPADPRGKLLVRPGMRADDVEYPLAGIFLLGQGDPVVPIAEALRLMPSHMFRPNWLDQMAGREQRFAWLIDLAGMVPVIRLPVLASFDAKARQLRLDTALTAMAG
jgi:hypothetical protein